MSNQDNAMEQILRRHRALAVLRFLDRSPEYRTNEEVLMSWLRHLALTCSREKLQDVTAFLETEGHLHTEQVDGLLVLTLSERGAEIANGREIVEGVERPGPECPY